MNWKWLLAAFFATCAVLLGGSLLLPGCRSVPMAPDRPEYSQFAPSQPPAANPVSPSDGGVAEQPTPPAAAPTVEVLPLRFGIAKAPRCAAAGEASCLETSHIIHTAYLVKHPKATFLIDAGLSTRIDEDLGRLPLPVRLAFKFDKESSLKESLAKWGVAKLDFVVLTHAHWDHSSGLVDLEQPRVLLGPGEEAFLRSFPSDRPVVQANHFNNARLETVSLDGPPYEQFKQSRDYFGDGSVVMVPLPGHTPGSLGIFVNGVHGKRLFFIGDAGWSMDAVELPSHKLKPMSNLADVNRTQLSETLWRLHHLHKRRPELLMVPAHDANAFDAVANLTQGPAKGPASP